MFSLGMIGTLIGFVLVFGDALANIDLNNEANKVKIIADMGIGISTAIYTTLAGLVCSVLLWIQLINLEYGISHYEEE
jgi:flagellar motor component MotA